MSEIEEKREPIPTAEEVDEWVELLPLHDVMPCLVDGYRRLLRVREAAREVVKADETGAALIVVDDAHQMWRLEALEEALAECEGEE